jgi:hypothetical protein
LYILTNITRSDRLPDLLIGARITTLSGGKAKIRDKVDRIVPLSLGAGLSGFVFRSQFLTGIV